MVFLATHSVASWAETRIGVAASTKPNADGVIGGNSQTLAAGSEVYANETVRSNFAADRLLFAIDIRKLSGCGSHL